MNIGDRVDDEKERVRGHDKEDENRTGIKRNIISGACMRVYFCAFVFQDYLPLLQFFSVSDNDPSQSALKPPIYQTPTSMSLCTTNTANSQKRNDRSLIIFSHALLQITDEGIHRCKLESIFEFGHHCCFCFYILLLK